MYIRRVLAIAIAILLAQAFAIQSHAEFRLLHQGTNERVIVFVHGLYGDPIDTFQHDPKGPSWPDLIKSDTEIVGDYSLSTYSVGLLSYPASPNDRLTVPDVSQRLLQSLANSPTFQRFKHVVFVTHSLGGVVVKQMLLHASREGASRGSSTGLYERTAAVFLIAVPSTGSDVASLAAILPRLATGRIVVDLKPIEENTYLQNLEVDWVLFMEARNALKRPSVLCMFERQSTYGVMVVPESRSATRCDGPRIAENKDHISIVKPQNRSDFVYNWVRGNIGRIDWAATLPPVQKNEAGPVQKAIASPECVNSALERLRQLSPFSIEGGIRCEGAGVIGRGQSRSSQVVYSIPPNHRLIGAPQIEDLSRNNGQFGPIEYEPSRDETRIVRVNVSCESPSRPFGPGAWMQIRLSGQVERVPSAQDRAEAEARCGK